MSNKKLIITGSEEGEILAIAGSNYRIILTGEQTENKLAIIEMNVPPNSGPVPHEHPLFAESFYVLEGEVEMRTKDGRYTAKKGTIVTIPKDGPVHCFKNVSNSMAKLLCMVSPAGLDDFFREVGRPMAFGEKAVATPLTDADKEKMNETAVRYGQKLYPPDYLDQ